MLNPRLKLANSVTFDRMDKTLKHLRRIAVPSPSILRDDTSGDKRDGEDKSQEQPQPDEDEEEDIASVTGDHGQGKPPAQNDERSAKRTELLEEPSVPPTETTSTIVSGNELSSGTNAVSQSTPLPAGARQLPYAHNTSLIHSLLGLETPTWQDSLPPTFKQLERDDGSEPQVEWLGGRLNDSQKGAIEFCLKADTVACIHGPPGVSSTSSFSSSELRLQIV